MRPLTAALTLCGAAVLAACVGQQARDPNGTTQSPQVACEIVEGKPSTQEATAAQVLRRGIEASPFYAIAAGNEGLAACRLRHRPDGVVTVDYQFKQGGQLLVTRDARIEYTEQDARYTLSPDVQPQAILALAERAAFGADGCGIDWQEPETKPAATGSGAMETIFRGDVCNCQARIRRDAQGRVVGLLLRGAC